MRSASFLTHGPSGYQLSRNRHCLHTSRKLSQKKEGHDRGHQHLGYCSSWIYPWWMFCQQGALPGHYAMSTWVHLQEEASTVGAVEQQCTHIQVIPHFRFSYKNRCPPTLTVLTWHCPLQLLQVSSAHMVFEWAQETCGIFTWFLSMLEKLVGFRAQK